MRTGLHDLHGPQPEVDRGDRPDHLFFVVLPRRAHIGLAPGWLPGRVGLNDSKERFRAAWGAEGSGVGRRRDARATAEARLGALTLVGCNPLSGFPDRGLARDALERVGFLGSVDLILTDSSSRAQVVLPATGAGDKAGTIPNLEGRVRRLGRKVAPPGTARQDWMIAVELADRLGAGLGVESLAEIWAEIEERVPVHAGLTPICSPNLPTPAGSSSR